MAAWDECVLPALWRPDRYSIIPSDLAALLRRDHRASRSQCVSHSCLPLPIAHPSTPAKQSFAALQHKTWPVYFQLSTALSAACIYLLYRADPAVFDSLLALRAGGLLSVGSLLAVFVGQATNWLVLGPMTSRLLYERDRLEKGEKKGPEVSVDAGVWCE